jgi:hypothetical protein
MVLIGPGGLQSGFSILRYVRRDCRKKKSGPRTPRPPGGPPVLGSLHAVVLWPLHAALAVVLLWLAFACALLAASAFNSLPFELINQTSPAVLAVRVDPCRWRRASRIS